MVRRLSPSPEGMTKSVTVMTVIDLSLPPSNEDSSLISVLRGDPEETIVRVLLPYPRKNGGLLSFPGRRDAPEVTVLSSFLLNNDRLSFLSGPRDGPEDIVVR